jgi:hypothetical protein
MGGATPCGGGLPQNWFSKPSACVTAVTHRRDYLPMSVSSRAFSPPVSSPQHKVHVFVAPGDGASASPTKRSRLDMCGPGGHTDFNLRPVDGKRDSVRPTGGAFHATPSTAEYSGLFSLVEAALAVENTRSASLTPSPVASPVSPVTGPVRVYSCNVCGYKSDYKVNVTAHMRVHTGEKPFSCEKCGLSFAWKSNLKDHARTHTGVKPFRCTECGATFSRGGALKKHAAQHGEGASLSCSHCPAKFRDGAALSRHRHVHAETLHVLPSAMKDSLGSSHESVEKADVGRKMALRSVDKGITNVRAPSTVETAKLQPACQAKLKEFVRSEEATSNDSTAVDVCPDKLTERSGDSTRSSIVPGASPTASSMNPQSLP